MANRMSQQVVIGTMPTEGIIVTNDGEKISVDRVDHRAKWSFLRLQYRKSKWVDALVKEKKAELIEQGLGKIPARNAAMRELMEPFWGINQREIQYIIVNNVVKAVASTDHLLIPAAEVLSIAKRYMPDLTPSENFTGVVKEIGEIPGIKFQWHMDPGNVLTRMAIRIGYALRITMCFNPLSFLGTGNFDRFLKDTSIAAPRFPGLSKILRVKQKHELEERIVEAIEGRGKSLAALEAGIKEVKATELRAKEAVPILTAFPLAYGAGKSTVQQIVRRFEKEDPTLWGAAMASSYVAQHGDFRTGGEGMRKKLGVSAAGIMMLNDPKKTADLCQEWLDKKGVNLEEWK